MMNRLTEEIKLRRKAKAVKRDQRRKELFEAFYQVSMGKIKESALPEDLDGSYYWNLVDTYRDCMNNEYAIRNLSDHPIQFWLFNDRKEMEIAANCRAICEKMKARDERHYNGLAAEHRMRQIYV